MKLTYKQRIFCYFLLIFAVFSASTVYFEQKQEKAYRTQNLESRLGSYADMIHNYMVQNQLADTAISRVSRIVDVLPAEVRVTIIRLDGRVIYDNEVPDVSKLDNHKNRPEIMKSLYQGVGSNIRMSASKHREFLYFSHVYPDHFVRVALPYTVETKALLRADNLFIYVVVVLFVMVMLLLNFVAGRFSQSLRQLRNFAVSIRENKPLPEVKIDFPQDDLGQIGQELVEIFQQKAQSRREIEIEREKLIRHLQYSGEGFAIFSSERRKIYANTHFIQYLNLIKDTPTFEIESIFDDPQFKPLIDFLDLPEDSENYWVFQLVRNGKTFHLQVVKYEDNSFEVTIRDITKTEKTRLLKQEMTNNIAHELRTPVSSLRAYLETICDKQLPADKQRQFLERAYMQSVRLSELIEDVSLLSKIEEASSQFPMEKIDLHDLVDNVRIDLTDKLQENQIKFVSTLREHLYIHANYSLIYSIFRNLVDNSIKYAGKNIEIHIDNYTEDKDHLYFSYYDTGKGIDEQHLQRIFERFYRVDKGRTRDAGGSGLGLSIVKNAIMLHKGEIQARNRDGKGLEFLFSISKQVV
jgi:two-component system OmpR family sensor kinase/two-component system phosphate regulon sensor histidine kinase PhoR